MQHFDLVFILKNECQVVVRGYLYPAHAQFPRAQKRRMRAQKSTHQKVGLQGQLPIFKFDPIFFSLIPFVEFDSIFLV